MDRATAIALSSTVLLLAVPLGGCLGLGIGGPGDATTTTPPTDTTTPPTDTTTPPTTDPPTTDPPTTEPPTTTPPRGSYRSIGVEAERVIGADLVDAFVLSPGEFDPARRPVVRRLLNRSNHTVTTHHLGHPGHVDDGELLAGEDAFYRVDRTVLDRRTVTVHRFELSTVRDPDDAVRSAAVALDDLPAVDRAVVRKGLPTGERLGEGSFTAGYRYAFPNGTVPDGASLADGEAHYVTVDGNYYRIRTIGTQRATRYRVRYEAGFVTESRTALAGTLVDDHVANVTALPNGSGQRALLVRALEGREVRWETRKAAEPPADFAALRDLFGEYRSEAGAMYVRHDGDLYRVELRVVVS